MRLSTDSNFFTYNKHTQPTIITNTYINTTLHLVFAFFCFWVSLGVGVPAPKFIFENKINKKRTFWSMLFSIFTTLHSVHCWELLRNERSKLFRLFSELWLCACKFERFEHTFFFRFWKISLKFSLLQYLHFFLNLFIYFSFCFIWSFSFTRFAVASMVFCCCFFLCVFSLSTFSLSRYSTINDGDNGKTTTTAAAAHSQKKNYLILNSLENFSVVVVVVVAFDLLCLNLVSNERFKYFILDLFSFQLKNCFFFVILYFSIWAMFMRK